MFQCVRSLDIHNRRNIDAVYFQFKNRSGMSLSSRVEGSKEGSLGEVKLGEW